MEWNELCPVFPKVSQLNVLIGGGGNVAAEKLAFLLKSSPNAKVEMVSPMNREGTRVLAEKSEIQMHVSEYGSN